MMVKAQAVEAPGTEPFGASEEPRRRTCASFDIAVSLPYNGTKRRGLRRGTLTTDICSLSG
jgi:hypothetical protein